MKKILFLGLTVFAFVTARSQEQILLMTETFDKGSNPFVFDDAQNNPGGNFGNNDWTVNALYNGQPLYPNTPGEDQVASGNIDGAPHSNYLHIHDIAAVTSNSIGNDNWNPNNASDRFCYIGNSFCTLGMTEVNIEFFWISEGNANAYGEFYYRADGGPWTKTGQAKYNNQSIWKFEQIKDPGFANVQSLQFGFRWVNPGGGGTPTIAFGIDDIIAIGGFNNTDPNTALTIHTQVFNSQICAGDPVLIQATLSQVLCDGQYQVQLSDSTGDFTTSYDLADFQLSAPNKSAFGYTIGTDGTLHGNCFRIRVVHVNEPLFIGDTSACFKIIKCTDTIWNVKVPVISNDGDTACIQSEVDVKFNSKYLFLEGNDYIAELSDANGSFSNPYVLGHLPVRDSFPAMPPGNISGVIPKEVPPGCGYYVRVRALHPAIASKPIGPYCLVHCDELTNNITDLHFCVSSGPYPSCDTINIAPNHWAQNMTYDTCNSWSIQLRSMDDFSLVDNGSLGIYYDKTGGNYKLCMPASKDLLPVQPGAYYMRIVSNPNCTNQPWNTTGSVIRITIGAPDAMVSLTAIPDTVVCAGTPFQPKLLEVQESAYNQKSQYFWATNMYNNGDEFEYDFPVFGLYLEGVPLGDYIWRVREVNFGCNGPSSAPLTVTIIGAPDVNIIGDTLVCKGDTSTYNVTYLKETYYDWEAPNGGVDFLQRSNSEVVAIFDTLGYYTLTNFSLNSCGSDNGKVKIHVIPTYFDAEAKHPDQKICIGDPANIAVYTSELNKIFVAQDSGKTNNKQGGMFNIIARGGDVTIDSFAVKLLSSPAQLEAEVYGKSGTYLGHETNANDWQLLTQNHFITPSNQKFTIINAPVGQFIAKGDSFAFYVTTANTGPTVPIAYGRGSGVQGTIYKSDAAIDFVQGTVLNYPFKSNIPGVAYILNVEVFYTTRAGFKYTWNTGQTVDSFTVHPTQNTTYAVRVTDNGRCHVVDTTHVIVLPNPLVNAGPDTALCPDQVYVMPGQAVNSSIVWQPSTDLNANNILNPTFSSHSDSITYIIVATDSTTGCSSRDTVTISVPMRLTMGPDVKLCDGASDTLFGAVTNGQYFLWTPSVGLDDSSSLTPVFNSNYADNGGIYTLTVTNLNGCKLSGSLDITTEICILHVPQIFTPNGDGNNDHFTVFADDPASIGEYEIKIYNRWGELVYDSKNKEELNQLSMGWDGTYKGKMQDSGTFVYYVYTKSGSKKLEKKGNLTLVR